MKNQWIGLMFVLLVPLILCGCTEQTATQQKKEQSLRPENTPPVIQECKVEYFDRWDSPTVYFIAYAVDEDGYVSYHWTLSDGCTSTEQSFIHTFEIPGIYQAELEVYDIDGAMNSTHVSVSIAGSIPENQTNNETLLVGIWSNSQGDTVEFTGDGYFVTFGNWTRDRYWIGNGRLSIYSITTHETMSYIYYFEGKNTLVFYPFNLTPHPENRWTRNH